jgi:hypothetical protein
MSKDINQALKEWQAALRLQDWDITAEILPNAEYEYRRKTDKESASVRLDRSRMMDAEIIIKESSEDKEFSLVHELVHIHLEPLSAAFDQAIGMAPGKECQKVLRGNLEYELEILVNRLTRAFMTVRDMAQGANDKEENPIE